VDLSAEYTSLINDPRNPYGERYGVQVSGLLIEVVLWISGASHAGPGEWAINRGSTVDPREWAPSEASVDSVLDP
jgi:hypothetical protein